MMARAFWFSLLIGYLAGAFAAAIYLPRAVLAPSLSNLLLLTAFSTLFVSVVSWRAWRARDAGLPGWPWQSTGSVGVQAAPAGEAGGLDIDADDDELLLLARSPAPLPASSGSSLPTDPDIALRGRETPETRPRREPAGRVHVAAERQLTEPDGQSDLICLAEPLVQLPQRRLIGRRLRASLAQGRDRFTRQDMIARGLGAASLHEFDLAAMQRLLDWLGREASATTALGSLLIDLHINALKSRKSRRLLAALSATIADRGGRLTLALQLPMGQPLPRLQPDSIGPGVGCLLRTAEAVRPDELLAAGFAGVAMDHRDFQPYLRLSLDDDPIFAGLRALDDQGGRIVIEGFRAEGELRDVFDYPCHQATGPLFGEASVLSAPTAAHSSRAAAPTFGTAGRGTERLRGQMGYGAATSLARTAPDERYLEN